MAKSIEEGINQVVCQKWEESERGWGCRPDGFSLHLSYEGLARYIKFYWDSMPNEAPDEYSKPDGTPYPVGVGDSILAQMQEDRETGGGGDLRFPSFYEYPGSGGIDGWTAIR